MVTALFADLVDYVRMLVEHDPEVVRARVTAALATMAEAIAHLGGTREKFIGDAVFAVFGWPQGHDDDSVRAALAALSIRAGLQDPRDGAEPLEVRIGIATGEVVASGDGPTVDGDLRLTGEAITTAARIQSLARPGEILLDGPTLQAARGRLATEPSGSVVLRGQSTPVELFVLRGEVGMGPWASHRSPVTGPLVGRAREMAILLGAIDRCRRTGTGGTVVVVGEAGVGKSRLLAALEAPARDHGFRWSWTENVSYGRGEPYRYARLFAQAMADEEGVDSGTLTRRLLFRDEPDAATIRRLGGAIAAIARDASFSGWEEEAPDAPNEAAEVTASIVEVAARYLERLFSSTGLRVVVVDDLHWLDPSSVGLIELLVDAATNHPLVILAGTRPGVLPSWMARADVERLDLRGLDAPETARLATLVARAAVDADGARSIHDRTGGNPLFVSETVRAYLEDGTLALRDGRVALIDPAQPRVPITLRAVLGARIDALDPAAREAVGVASVIGIRFTAALLNDLLDESLEPGVLDRLADAAIILPVEDGDWRFAHALIHDAAYAGLLASQRRGLHARLADHLETHAESPPIEQIAAHRAAAGDAERALPLLREAAQSAITLGAATEAAAFWRRAAELATPTDPAGAAADLREADAALRGADVMRAEAGVERP
ncbi:MAG: AAA family ATPase [Candidatus Limnocylindrales bacterium]